MGDVAGPFYFAWVDETDNVFGSGHHRCDEYIFSAHRTLSEGDPAKLVLEIENPRTGLLSALRKQWAHFAWDNGTSIVPLFFGRIVGVPDDMESETVTVTFIAKPSNYKKQLQTVAETMKTLPFYDPVFIDVAHRDDPMSIFETWSSLPCIDPVTLVVTAEDILEASDGNVDFTADDGFYDSVKINVGTVPKTAVHVDMTVSWTQQWQGFVDIGTRTLVSYTGDGIISDWPKPLTQIEAGLTVFTSEARDNYDTTNIYTDSDSWNWTNGEKKHEDGDTLSTSISWSTPQIHGPFVKENITYSSRIGYLDPFATDDNGDPAPVNLPPWSKSTDAYVPAWSVTCSMVLECRAERPHTERVEFNLFADVQPTVLNPAITDDSESISLNGADVSVPIINLLNWTTVSGTFVDVGTIVFPDDPHLPGNQTAQVVINDGTTGVVEPDFSDIPGETTVDGTATWASLGVATPTENAPDWTRISTTPTGQTILPKRPLYTTYASFTAASKVQFPPAETSISEGTIIQMPDGSFQICTVAGSLGITAVMVTIQLPDGKTYYIAVQGGITGTTLPPFNTTLHGTTGDGSVIWACIGTGEIPIGDVSLSSYFTTDRGARGLQYGICRGRARLRFASRVVSGQFQCDYLKGTTLSLRKTATLHDPRLPGGLVLGKITGTDLFADGGSGAFACNVTIQASVGLATTIEEQPGTVGYVAPGFVATMYDYRPGRVIVLPVVSDIGYSTLVPVPDEDGISFPLTKGMFVVRDQFIDSGQGDAVSAGLDVMKKAANIGPQPGTDGEGRDRSKQMLLTNDVSHQLKDHPAWQEFEFKPINRSFQHVFHLKCTNLSVPQMINLEEESVG